jgi:spore germination protein GerM
MRLKRYFLAAPAILIVLGALFLFLKPEDSSQTVSRAKERTPKRRPQALTKSAANLYFADKDNFFLIAETRTLARPGEPEEFGKVIFQALEKGPSARLTRTIPTGASVRALYLGENGTAVIDLSESVSENHPGGCKTELLTVYSLVNSLVLNIPEIDSVKILIGGREAMTLAGHMDLRFPFKANMLLVR